jgi:hypothetical protein
MSVLTKTVRNAVVYYDSLYPWRWYDAFGAGVCKYLQEFVALPVDDTTHDPLDFTNTIVEAAGASTAEVTDYAGGALLITSGTAEDDGFKMQLGHGAAGVGENFIFDAQYPFYFGINFAVSNASEVDVFAGLAVTDTDALGAVTDGLYFRKIDGDTNVYFVAEKDSLESATAVLTMMGAQYRTFEMYYDGATLYHYVDNRLTGSINRVDPTFPNNELMRLTIEFLTGSADARTMTIDWVKVIQIRD